MQLYEKIEGKRVRYVPYTPPAATVPKQDEFTDGELLTLAVSMGVVVLHQIEQHRKPHNFITRKVAAVENALLELARGLGEPVDDEMCAYWWDAWNRVMQEISSGMIKDVV